MPTVVISTRKTIFLILFSIFHIVEREPVSFIQANFPLFFGTRRVLTKRVHIIKVLEYILNEHAPSTLALNTFYKLLVMSLSRGIQISVVSKCYPANPKHRIRTKNKSGPFRKVVSKVRYNTPKTFLF